MGQRRAGNIHTIRDSKYLGVRVHVAGSSGQGRLQGSHQRCSFCCRGSCLGELLMTHTLLFPSQACRDSDTAPNTCRHARTVHAEGRIIYRRQASVHTSSVYKHTSYMRIHFSANRCKDACVQQTPVQ